MIVFRGIFKDALADGVVKVNPVALKENRKVLKQAPATRVIDDEVFLLDRC